jgi:predicted nuclease with TOPRIM domain
MSLNFVEPELEEGIFTEKPRLRKKGKEFETKNSLLQDERLKRLKLQNKKLDTELRKLRGQVGDIEKHRREVLAANSTVKQQVLAVPFRLSLQLAQTTDPAECARIMGAALVECLNDLAYAREEKS